MAAKKRLTKKEQQQAFDRLVMNARKQMKLYNIAKACILDPGFKKSLPPSILEEVEVYIALILSEKHK